MNTQTNQGQRKDTVQSAGPDAIAPWVRGGGLLLAALFLLWAWEAGASAFTPAEPAFFASHGVWILLPLVALGAWGSVLRLGRPQDHKALSKIDAGLWGLLALVTCLHLYLTLDARGTGSAYVEEILFRELAFTPWFAVYLLGLNATAFVAGMGIHRLLSQFWQASNSRSRAFFSVAGGFMVWVLAIDTLSRYASGAPLW